MPIVDGKYVARQDILKTLGASEEDRLQVPVQFDTQRWGTFGLWYTRDLYRVGSHNEAIKDTNPVAMTIYESKNYIEAFYATAADAQVATKAIGEGFVEHWLRIQSEKKYSYGLQQPERWSDPLVFNVKNIVTLRSSKRHEYHMVFLPSAVYAAAQMMGYNVPPMAAFDELNAQDVIFDDALTFAMIGNPDADADDDDHWTKSKLWLQREALWKALGEPDARKYLLPGTGQPKMETQSEKLCDALSFTAYGWHGAYAKLSRIPDPSPAGFREGDSDGGRQNRWSLIAVDKFYTSDAAMRADADEQAARISDKGDGTTPPFEGGFRLPEAWNGIPMDEFQSALTDEIAKGKPDAMTARNLEITVDELKAARAHFSI